MMLFLVTRGEICVLFLETREWGVDAIFSNMARGGVTMKRRVVMFVIFYFLEYTQQKIDTIFYT